MAGLLPQFPHINHERVVDGRERYFLQLSWAAKEWLWAAAVGTQHKSPFNARSIHPPTTTPSVINSFSLKGCLIITVRKLLLPRLIPPTERTQNTSLPFATELCVLSLLLPSWLRWAAACRDRMLASSTVPTASRYTHDCPSLYFPSSQCSRPRPNTLALI